MTVLWIVLAALGALGLYDLVQTRHAILRNFPLIGHLRYLLEMVGPELRQYIVTSNDEERPFSRDQRTWVYTSAKKQNNYFGFGTDNKVDSVPNYLVIKHAARPASSRGSEDGLPSAKVLGGARGRKKAQRLPSVVNVSAMSFGSLSARAIEALNRGCQEAGCWHNTGEGGISPYHRKGGDLVWQLGTGYFGCRDSLGRFDVAQFKDRVAEAPVRAIEIKLSQGAKPGLGGVLPSAKITDEISKIRGIPRGRDCVSPPGHTAFTDVDSLLDFVEELAALSGLPIGIKSAVGEERFWGELARHMESGDRGVDFVTIDGGEGGTGAAPLAFSDHVSLPFKIALPRVYRAFAERDLCERVFFFGSGKLGFPETAMFAFAMGCDGIQVARESMLAIGCIQAQRCHTGHCPTGVATQNRWLVRGLNPESKATRLANYVKTLRKELVRLSNACGVVHPSLVNASQIEILDGRYGGVTLREHYGYESTWGLPSDEDRRWIEEALGTKETLIA